MAHTLAERSLNPNVAPHCTCVRRIAYVVSCVSSTHHSAIEWTQTGHESATKTGQSSRSMNNMDIACEYARIGQ
jgi:hypothetical protein